MSTIESAGEKGKSDRKKREGVAQGRGPLVTPAHLRVHTPLRVRALGQVRQALKGQLLTYRPGACLDELDR